MSRAGGGSWRASWRRRDPGPGCIASQQRSRRSGRAGGRHPVGCTGAKTFHTPACARARSTPAPSAPGWQKWRKEECVRLNVWLEIAEQLLKEAIASSLCRAVNVLLVFFYQAAQFLRIIQQQQGNKRKSCKFWGQLLYPVLSQECGGFSLISNGQPDVWERGEVVAQTLTHLYLDELARRRWEHKEKESILFFFFQLPELSVSSMQSKLWLISASAFC